jgi:hypothetical protein
MRPTERGLALIALVFLGACSGKDREPTGPTSGSINLVVAGLPAGVSAKVTLSGPAGYSRILAASTRVNGLPTGSYTVSAQHVSGPGVVYNATVSSPTVAVTAGDVAAVTVTYTGGAAPTLNLKIAGTQLIQSSQRSDGTVPMVAGRDVLYRIFVTANQANTAQPMVRVLVYSGSTKVDSLDVAGPAGGVPLSVDTSNLSASWNVIIPPARVTTALGVAAVLDPSDAIAEADESDNRLPKSGKTAVTVQTVPAFHLRFVPVHQSANGLTGSVNSSSKGALADLTHRMWPLSAMDVDVRSTYTTAAPALSSNDVTAWGQILSEVYTLESTDGSTRHYVGIVGTSYNSGIAGLGYVGAPAAIAWDKAGSAPGVVAHELGHNFGRNHAPCGNPSGPDPNYPYPNAAIGSWGLDQGSLSLKGPSGFVDLMSYCSPQWVSDYNYLAVLNFRGTGPVVVSSDEQTNGGISVGPAGPGLLVWGRIRRDSLILEPAFTVNAPSRMPQAAGAYRLAGRDANGAALFDFSFDGELVADLPGGAERHFAFVVPLSSTEADRLNSLSLGTGGLQVERRALSALSAQSAQSAMYAPTARRQATGDTEVRWNSSYPMALVRDGQTGEVLGFARGGSVQLVTNRTRLVVQVSDGVRDLTHSVSVAP